MVNPISFPQYNIDSRVDFSPLAKLPEIMQQAQARQVLGNLQRKPDGSFDTAPLFASGDMNLARLGMQIESSKTAAAHDARDFGFRQTEAQRAQQNADRSYTLQQSQERRAAAAAEEGKFTIKEVEDPDTGAKTLVRVKTTGPEGPVSTGAAAATAPSQPANPFNPTRGKFNEGEGKAAGFSDRMLNSESILSGIGPGIGFEGPVKPGVQGAGRSTVQTGLSSRWAPGGNFAVSEERQKYNQAKQDFINAQLRRESGAAISPSEFDNADKQYFPVPGDSDALVRQKAENRRLAVAAMAREGGRSYRPKATFDEQGTVQPYGAAAPPATVAAPAAVEPPPAPRPGELRDGYRFKGGNPADPNSWVKVK